MIASDLLPVLPLVIKQLKEDRKESDWGYSKVQSFTRRKLQGGEVREEDYATGS